MMGKIRSSVNHLLKTLALPVFSVNIKMYQNNGKKATLRHLTYFALKQYYLKG